MTDKSQNSGVRNLRAMFESQNAASSPEPRGRSPAGGARNSIEGDRPASNKIRASFVSVVPNVPNVPASPISPVPRDLGATKGTADGINSISAHHRESFSVSAELGEDVATELKKDISQEKEARKNSEVIAETIPEQAVETRESSRAPPPIRDADGTMPNLGTIMKGSDFPEPQTEAQPEKEQKPKAIAAAEPAQQLAPQPEPTPEPAPEVKPEPAPVTAPEPEPASEDISQKLAALSLSDAPGDNPDKVVTGVQEEASLRPADPKDENAVSGGQAIPPPAEVLPTTETAAAPATPKAPEREPSPAKVTATPSKTETNSRLSAKKPSAIATNKTPGLKATPAKSPALKSPGLTRPPRTPTTPRAAAASAAKSPVPAKEKPKTTVSKEPSKAPAPRTSRPSIRPSIGGASATASAKDKAPAIESKRSTTKPVSGTTKPVSGTTKPVNTTKPVSTTKPASTATAPRLSKDTEKGTTTSEGGFKKPKPRSPTKPVQLPSHLVAPTKASAAKHGEEAAAEKPARKPTTAPRTSLAPKTTTTKKQPARASLTPSTAPAKRPESRASTKGGSDEGFLARMMRPTKASASKTHEKPASPPRRGASVKGSAKPKTTHEGPIAAGKKKVEEVAHKAKEAITSDHGEEHKNEDTGAGAQNESVAEPSEVQKAEDAPTDNLEAHDKHEAPELNDVPVPSTEADAPKTVEAPQEPAAPAEASVEKEQPVQSEPQLSS